VKSLQQPGRVIIVFLTLVSLLYVAGFWLIFRLSSATPLMLTVGISAVLTCLLMGKKLATLGFNWPKRNFLWAGYLLPLGYGLAAYSVIWAVGFGDWYNVTFVLEEKENYNLGSWTDAGIIVFHFLVTATISFVLLLPSVLGEEIGWRGLLVPELSKIMPFSGVAIASGLLWSAWHWPLIFSGIYGTDLTPMTFQLLFFTLGLVSMSVIMTYFRLKTNSLWPAVLLHMSHNIFLQKFFTPMTEQNNQSAWFIDEFGAVLPLTIFLFALYFWRKE